MSGFTVNVPRKAAVRLALPALPVVLLVISALLVRVGLVERKGMRGQLALMVSME